LFAVLLDPAFEEPDKEADFAVAGFESRTGFAAFKEEFMGFKDEIGLGIVGGVTIEAMLTEQEMDGGVVGSGVGILSGCREGGTAKEHGQEKPGAS
jgi:hypothetical protein